MQDLPHEECGVQSAGADPGRGGSTGISKWGTVILIDYSVIYLYIYFFIHPT